MNKTYEVLYSPSAVKDIEGIYNYIKMDNVDAADKLVDKFEKIASKVSLYPNMGTLAKNERLKRSGYRILIVDDYMVFL